MNIIETYRSYSYLILGITLKKCALLIEETSLLKKINLGLEIGDLYCTLNLMIQRLNEDHSFDGVLYGNKTLYNELLYVNIDEANCYKHLTAISLDIQRRIIEMSSNILMKHDINILEQIEVILKKYFDNRFESNLLSNWFKKVSKEYAHYGLFTPFQVNYSHGRPKDLIKGNKKSFNAKSNIDLVTNETEWNAFLHYVLIDVELTAIEICGINILKNIEMPIPFYCDMMRQIGDESRHSMFIFSELSKNEVQITDYPYTSFVLDRFLESDNLAEGLAIQQILQEGNAVEVNTNLVEALKKANKKGLARQFNVINIDEGLHVIYGNKWLKYLLKDDYENQFIKILVKASNKTDLPLFGKGGWNSQTRKQTGFPIDFIEAKEMLDND